MITENITLVQKIGDVVSTILLGDTKERIVRMDEKLNALSHLDSDLKDVRERLPAVEQKLGFVQAGLSKLEDKVEKLQTGFTFLSGKVDMLASNLKA